jgi:hypothetical protein
MKIANKSINRTVKKLRISLIKMSPARKPRSSFR